MVDIIQKKSGPEIMEVIYNHRFSISVLTRSADVGKNNGDDSLRLSLLLSNSNIGENIAITDMLMNAGIDFDRLKKAYKNHEHLQIWITTDFLKDKE